MKVLLANKFFFRKGGAEVVMFQERDHLRRSGVHTIDFSMCDPKNLASPYAKYFVAPRAYKEDGDGLMTRMHAALTLIHSSEAVSQIGRLIDRERPDVVHCHNIYHQLTPSIIGAATRRGIPVVLTLHDCKPVCPTYLRLCHGKPCSACLSGSFFPVLRYRCAEGSLAKSALLYAEAVIQRWLRNYEKVSRFIAPSRFVQQSVAGRFPAERVQVLYNSVDPAAFNGTGADGGYALYLGRLSDEKGIRTLLHAHERARGRWSLTVAGTGPLQSELQAQFGAAKFLGHISGPELKKTIDGASVIVVPSECYENCPMSVLEAMACGKPVVCSRVGGIPEVVVEGVTGLLFEPGNADQLSDCMTRIMTDLPGRQRMGAAGKARVEEHFSIREHNRQLLEIYRAVSGVAVA